MFRHLSPDGTFACVDLFYYFIFPHIHPVGLLFTMPPHEFLSPLQVFFKDQIGAVTEICL